jgi:hypothetical protein
MDVAQRAADDKAFLAQNLRPLRPHQKGNVTCGRRQPAPEISANATGANHENTHAENSFAYMMGVSGLSKPNEGQATR